MTFVPPTRRDFFLLLLWVRCKQMAPVMVIFGERFYGRLFSMCRDPRIRTKKINDRKTEHNRGDKTV